MGFVNDLATIYGLETMRSTILRLETIRLWHSRLEYSDLGTQGKSLQLSARPTWAYKLIKRLYGRNFFAEKYTTIAA